MVDYNNLDFCLAFGKKIRQLRAIREKSVEDIASEIGMSTVFVSMVESGRVGLLTDGIVSKFCDACGCKAFDLKAETERVAMIYFLVNHIENILRQNISIHDKALMMSDLVRDAVCLGYKTSMCDSISDIVIRGDYPDTSFVELFDKQSSVSVEKEAQILSKLCSKLRPKAVTKPVAGGKSAHEFSREAEEFVDNFVEFDF